MVVYILCLHRINMRKIVLDIENELRAIDFVFRKYITLPEGVVYLKNNRYPISDRKMLDTYSKMNMISNEPWHPMLCVPTVLEILSLYIYSETSEFDYFRHNILIKNNSKCFIKTRNIEPVSILSDYFNTHNILINNQDSAFIMDTIDSIYYPSIYKHIAEYPNNIYTFEDNTSNIILVDSGDIKAYRYTEYIRYIEGYKI